MQEEEEKGNEGEERSLFSFGYEVAVQEVWTYEATTRQHKSFKLQRPMNEKYRESADLDFATWLSFPLAVAKSQGNES